MILSVYITEICGNESHVSILNPLSLRNLSLRNLRITSCVTILVRSQHLALSLWRGCRAVLLCLDTVWLRLFKKAIFVFFLLGYIFSILVQIMAQLCIIQQYPCNLNDVCSLQTNNVCYKSDKYVFFKKDKQFTLNPFTVNFNVSHSDFYFLLYAVTVHFHFIFTTIGSSELWVRD